MIIDLKRALIYMEDGYSATGAVNDATPPATGTTVTVDGFAKAIPVGAVFQFTGDDTEYTVVSTVGGATPTSITFTPTLTEATTDDQVITIGGRRLEVEVGEGTASFSEKKNREYKLSRGKIYQVRNGDEAPMEVKLSFLWEFLRSASGDTMPTPYEVLKQIGLASDWLSTGSDPCAPYAIDIVIRFAPECLDIDGEIYRFPEFRYDSIDGDPKTGEIQTPGKCNVQEPVITRAPLLLAV